MADELEVIQAITVLRAAYINKTISPKQFREMIPVWAAGLDDIPGSALAIAVTELYKESKWFPSVSEIREAAMKTREMQYRLLGLCPTCCASPCHCDVLGLLEAADVPQLEAATG